MSTARTLPRSELLWISRDVMRGLRALAMRSDDPLLDSADAVADTLLRERLATMPEVAERQKRINAFFKELNQTDDFRDPAKPDAP